MIDLHTHSIFSDGELIPAELVRRASVKGYRAIAITDHADHSNLEFIISNLIRGSEFFSWNDTIHFLPGVELTHVPPSLISDLAAKARSLGAKIIVAHGETIVEPVMPGTNHAALKSDIDILAHPGLITEDDMILATRNNVYVEISARRGHCLTNGHIVSLARKHHTKLVLNTDGHAPNDLCSKSKAVDIAKGAGMSGEEIDRMFRNSEALANR